MDQLRQIWQQVQQYVPISTKSKVAGGTGSPGSTNTLTRQFLNLVPVELDVLLPASLRPETTNRQSIVDFYSQVINDHADLLVAVSLALIIAGAAWLVFQVLKFIFLPFKKDWVAPRSKPKRYPKKVIDAMPPPYPNGWFRLVRADDMKRGEVRQVELCGRTIAVSRAAKDVDGQPVIRAFDALCPHLGANLAEGRLTKDGCIECPFHAWKFNLEQDQRCQSQSCGKLANIPYSPQSVDSVPHGANQLKMYELEEANGIIFAWIDAEERRGKEIPYRPYQHPQIAPNYRGSLFGGYNYQGETIHYIRAHMAELPENGSDNSHFKYTHQESVLPNILPMLEHDMSAVYDPSGKPVLELQVIHILRLWGFAVSSMKTRVVQCGPGFAVLHIDQGALGEVIICETITPIYPMLIRTTHTCYTPLRIPRPIAKIMFAGMVIQYDRDAAIFDKKVPLPQPAFVKTEDSMQQYRRWWKQFYSPKSVSMADAIAECEVGVVGGGGTWTEFGEIDMVVTNGESFGRNEKVGRRRARRMESLEW